MTIIFDDDNDDSDKFGGGHSNKTHTPIIAFKQKDSNLKTFGHSSKENCRKLPLIKQEAFEFLCKRI